ncbi:MAG TPA: Rossmann-like and DUF2520 domain-containing protein [Bacteroidota bacterium]
MKPHHRRLNISLIGAGKVGSTLAVMLRRSGHTINAVVSLSRQSARACGRLVSCKNCSDSVSAIPASTTLIIIAVPDNAVQTVAASLAGLTQLDFSRTQVCHTSGALTSDVLEPVARRGARVFSFHPIQTFPRRLSLKDQIYTMQGVTYGIEGPRHSLRAAKALARTLGGEVIVVPKEAKILYHSACVLASNYPIALLGAIESLARKFTDKDLKPFRKLVETSVENAFRTGAGKALTGPIVRGDVETVARHLEALEDPAMRTLYRSLGVFALRLAEEERRLTPDQARRLTDLLDQRE